MGHVQPFHLPKAWRGPHCGDRKASELPFTLQLLPRLPHKPMTTEPLNSTPFCGPSLPPWPPWWGLHRLPNPPAHTCPCGCLQVSPSPVGFDHAFLVSLSSLARPNPVAWIWGPMAEVAMCSPNLLPFPPVDTARLHFPAAPVVGCGHVTEFWPVEYARRDVHKSLLGSLKNLLQDRLLSLSFCILAGCRASGKGI